MEDTTLINYHGSIRYETIGELIHLFKQQVPRLGIPLNTYKKILLIMIETLENMMKHSENSMRAPYDAFPELLLKFGNNQFIIQTCNPINSNNIQNLKTRIDFLNNLDQSGLKKLYKETITNGVFTKSGGAGLGLIEIAKISCNPIQYEFEPVNQEYSSFRQKITVDAK